jgi:competence ComEA-like helix-hairpin-helix protein
VRRRLLGEAGAAALVVLSLLTLAFLSRYPLCSAREDSSCDRPIELLAPSGQQAVWCNRDVDSLETLLDRLSLPSCRGAILTQAEGSPGQLLLRLAADCGVLERREHLSGHALLSLGLPLDLNAADERDLTAIPGLGPKLAHAIVRERERGGLFCSVSDLDRRVEGIGEVLVEKLRPNLTASCSQ